MSKEVLKIISDSMASLGLMYEFMEWTSDAVYPYFVGEYHETEPFTEDGLQESTFILTGFSRSTWLALENAKESIEQFFDSISGYSTTTSSGSCVAIFYGNSLTIQTGDPELKKMQINLSIKEWKVNENE